MLRNIFVVGLALGAALPAWSDSSWTPKTYENISTKTPKIEGKESMIPWLNLDSSEVRELESYGLRYEADETYGSRLVLLKSDKTDSDDTIASGKPRIAIRTIEVLAGRQIKVNYANRSFDVLSRDRYGRYQVKSMDENEAYNFKPAKECKYDSKTKTLIVDGVPSKPYAYNAYGLMNLTEQTKVGKCPSRRLKCEVGPNSENKLSFLVDGTPVASLPESGEKLEGFLEEQEDLFFCEVGKPSQACEIRDGKLAFRGKQYAYIRDEQYLSHYCINRNKPHAAPTSSGAESDVEVGR